MTSPFSAVLLAGGKSSRMGCDKAFIEFGGEPLWQRQLRILRELEPQETFLAAPSKPEWPNDVVVLHDAAESIGPLGGLVSALRRASTPLLLALAVDLPRMTSEYLRGLLLSSSAGCGSVPRGEPVVGVYPISALALAESCLADEHYSMQDFARQCAERGLVRQVEITCADEPLFLNMNTPEDLFAVAAVYDRRTSEPRREHPTVTDRRYR